MLLWCFRHGQLRISPRNSMSGGGGWIGESAAVPEAMGCE